nr:hypothetical protein [Tanacetum cinerariifolium]
MEEDGFGAYWFCSERVITDKGDVRDYFIEISFDKEFLGPAPFYVFIRDPVRRLCHKMIVYSIFGRGQAPKKVIGVDLFYLSNMDRGSANNPYLLVQYLFRHAEGKKSGGQAIKSTRVGTSATATRSSASNYVIEDREDRRGAHGCRGRTYQEFNSTLVGSSQMPYYRRVRPKTGDANTSTTPRIDDQPDP